MSSNYSTTYTYCLDAVSLAIGSLLICTGVYATFINPLQWVRVFGIPDPTPETAVLFPSATGRNLAAGIFVWILVLLDDRKTLGIFLLCWTWAGIADAWVIYRHPKAQNLGTHLRPTVLVFVLGALLLKLAP